MLCKLVYTHFSLSIYKLLRYVNSYKIKFNRTESSFIFLGKNNVHAYIML